MPQKPSFPSPLPIAPARGPAAHVQAAIGRATQAKMPERPPGAVRSTPASAATSSKTPAEPRPVAPHVQSALAWTLQAKTAPGTAGNPRGRVPAPHAASLKAALQLSKEKKKNDEEVTEALDINKKYNKAKACVLQAIICEREGLGL